MPSPSRGSRPLFVAVSALALLAGLVGLLASFAAAPPAGKGAGARNRNELPVPATYVVGATGVVTWRFLEAACWKWAESKERGGSRATCGQVDQPPTAVDGPLGRMRQALGD